jgi:hypothetical protein
MEDANKRRIGLVLKIKGWFIRQRNCVTGCRHCQVHLVCGGQMSETSSPNCLSYLFDGGDFPGIADKTELVFRNDHYCFQQ